MVPYILTQESLTVVFDGKAHTMNYEHPSFGEAQKALKEEDWERLEKLFDVESAVQDYLDEDSSISVKDGGVYFKDEQVHNHVVDRILDFMRQGLPYKPLVKFLGKLMDNPSRRATNELYAFLEHKNMPLTPSGNFLAYKGVTEDFKDHFSRKFDNSVGQVLEMQRNGVCDDANIGCSNGFHAGSYEYAKGYAHNGGNLMVVEIDPSDVVSVPFDCDCQKLRTYKYKVVSHMETIERPLQEHLVTDYDEDEEEGLPDEYNEGYYAGYDAAKFEQHQKDLDA